MLIQVLSHGGLGYSPKIIAAIKAVVTELVPYKLPACYSMRHGPRRIGLVSLVVSHSGFSALFDDNDDAPAKRREIAGAFAAHENIPAKTLVFTGIVTGSCQGTHP